jgi:hypothetical protein
MLTGGRLMPYIKKCYREELDEHIDSLIEELKGWGEYNKTPKVTYIVYRLLKELFAREPAHWFEKAQALTVLSAVENEYYHKVIRPHEEDAIKRNGDI